MIKTRKEVLKNLKEICDNVDRKMIEYQNKILDRRYNFDKRELQSNLIYDINKIVDDDLIFTDQIEDTEIKDYYFRMISKIKSLNDIEKWSTLSYVVNTLYHTLRVLEG